MLRYSYGRWLGRSDAKVAELHGLDPASAITALSWRAARLHRASLRSGYWAGVRQVRSEFMPGVRVPSP